MHQDCDQKEKIDQILINQEQLGTDIKQAIEGLTKIIMADIEIRKDVEQLKKDREILFSMQRVDVARIEIIEKRNAKCDGAGIFENFPTMWNWYQQHKAKTESYEAIVKAVKAKVDKMHIWYLGEMGWRRFFPAAAAFVAACAAIFVALKGA